MVDLGQQDCKFVIYSIVECWFQRVLHGKTNLVLERDQNVDLA